MCGFQRIVVERLSTSSQQPALSCLGDSAHGTQMPLLLRSMGWWPACKARFDMRHSIACGQCSFTCVEHIHMEEVWKTSAEVGTRGLHMAAPRI